MINEKVFASAAAATTLHNMLQLRNRIVVSHVRMQLPAMLLLLLLLVAWAGQLFELLCNLSLFPSDNQSIYLY